MDRKLLFIYIFQYMSFGISISGLIMLFTILHNKVHDDALHIIMGLFLLVTGIFNTWLAFKLKKAHMNKLVYMNGIHTPMS